MDIKKNLKRIKNPLFDEPIISTNLKYLKEVKKHLKLCKIKKYKIVLEPIKKNTGPAILSSVLIDDIPENQPLIILSADHLIENVKFNDKIKNRKYLDNKNIFIFGIKPSSPSDQFGYFKTQKTKNIHKVYQFLEKPNKSKAKEIVKKGGY